MQPAGGGGRCGGPTRARARAARRGGHVTRRAGASWGPAAGRGEPPARRRSGGATGGEAGCPHGSARMGPTVRRTRGVDGGSGVGGNGRLRSSGCRFWRRKQWGSGGGGAGGDGFPRTASRWRTRRRPAAWCWTRRRRGGARPGSRGADRRLLQRRQGAGADGGRHRRSRAGERGPKARRRVRSAGDGGEPERSARSRGGGTAAAESFGQNALLQVGSNWPGGGRVVLVRMQPQYAREEI